MSETDHSETSESTIEPFQFEKVMENLESGAQDALQSKDFLSYSTLLDIYLNDPTKYSNEEKEQLLGHILTILSENKQLTYEIGWDLPQLLILYVDSDYEFNGPIRDSPGVYKILKIFENLAINGNHKELFLKSCELLNDLELSQDEDIELLKRENFFEIKLYCVFELIDACLKKIHTLYPSRFLAMTVSSFNNLMFKLTKQHGSLGNYHFVMKRVYSFCRNYISPPLPTNAKEMPQEELDKIVKDEEYLQRRLLTGFLTQVIYLANINGTEGYSIEHFSWLQQQSKSKIKFVFERDGAFCDRFVELASSFDIDLLKCFQGFITDSHKLLIGIDYKNKNKSEDEIIELLFERVVVDYQKNVLTSIVDSDAKAIKDSIIVVFWVWFALYQQQIINSKNLQLEISYIPKVLLTTFFQCLLFIVIKSEGKPNFKYMLLTLLTKLLTLSPDTGYEFIKDSLNNCPYESVYPSLIGVYKQLLLNEKWDVNSIELEKLNISSSSSNTPPKLPPRNGIKRKHFSLTNESLNDLVDLINNSSKNAFVEDNSKIDPSKLSTIAAYLNLLVAIKKDPVIVENKEKLTTLISSIENKIKSVKKSSQNQFELNAAGMLEITIERFNE
ncbi:hypothetical protein FOB64_003221 [Candida albicans]|uniref:Uncharacterized protein n=1 Tax=Candida albicans TaxID=5476 RepID=A0A8H6BY26_CANAX|nr:hypothetical protein FOB64_003221 [Candida albicans]